MIDNIQNAIALFDSILNCSESVELYYDDNGFSGLNNLGLTEEYLYNYIHNEKVNNSVKIH